MKIRAAGAWAGPLASTALLLAAFELGLRAADYRYAHYPISMRYVYSLAHLGTSQTLGQKNFRVDYTTDPILLWKPLRAAGLTNSDGFLGPEWSLEKSPGAKRVVALGDSCTVAGDDPYPAQLAARLSRFPRPPRWEVLNAGVGSWSSYQGRKLLETKLLRYRPDVVTIYFGWNDHWLAWAAPDKDLAALMNRQWRWMKFVERSRLLQALLAAADRVRGGALPRFSAATPYRVSLDDYEANLVAMVADVRAAGGEAVLVTAPTTLTPEDPVTAALCEKTHNFFDPRLIRTVHDAYNERVRSAARRTGAPLADLAAEFDGIPDAGTYFRDGIHLNKEGHARAAALLSGVIRAIQPRPHS
jgi:lysophospholipase L1-like esterase